MQNQSPLLRINDDVLHEISVAVLDEGVDIYGTSYERDFDSLKSLSSTCKYLRQALGPRVFRKIRFRVNDDADWRKTVTALETIDKCAFAKEYTRECDIQIATAVDSESDDDGLYGTTTRSDGGPLAPPQELTKKLCKLLSDMRQLNSLALVLPHSQAGYFGQVFEEANVCLPLVEKLALGPGMLWLIPACPNATTISALGTKLYPSPTDSESNSVYDLIKAAGKAPKLECFELDRACNFRMIERILEAMPDVPELRLNIRGVIRHRLYGHGLSVFLSTFARFSRLRLLDVMNIGDTPSWPWCGNAFDGLEGHERYERLRYETDAANRKVAEDIARACPNVERLRVAFDSAWLVERSEQGEYVGVKEYGPKRVDGP